MNRFPERRQMRKMQTQTIKIYLKRSGGSDRSSFIRKPNKRTPSWRLIRRNSIEKVGQNNRRRLRLI